MRFITPAFMFAAAAYVWWYNATNTGSVVKLPFIEFLVPSSKGDHARQGEISAWIFVAVGVIFFARAVWDNVRSSRLRRELEQEGDE